LPPELIQVAGIAIAAAGGAAIGLERQRSGHAEQRFAGIRTFTLLGGLAGLGGWMWSAGHEALGAILLGAGAALIVSAYVISRGLGADATTEVAALVVLAAGLRRREATSDLPLPSNPLQFTSALQMAALFQLVLFGVYWMQREWGEAGLLVSGAVLGLTDLDALTISMARSAVDSILLPSAAQATVIGTLSNTVLKLAVAVSLGRHRFRPVVASGLAALAVATLTAMWILR